MSVCVHHCTCERCAVPQDGFFHRHSRPASQRRMNAAANAWPCLHTMTSQSRTRAERHSGFSGKQMRHESGSMFIVAQGKWVYTWLCIFISFLFFKLYKKEDHSYMVLWIKSIINMNKNVNLRMSPKYIYVFIMLFLSPKLNALFQP